MSYRRRFNLDEVLREWAAEQVATSRDQRDPRRSGEEMAATADGAAEEDEVSRGRGYTRSISYSRFLILRSNDQNSLIKEVVLTSQSKIKPYIMFKKQHYTQLLNIFYNISS